MNKRLLFLYFVSTVLFSFAACTFVILQVVRHGIGLGCIISFLTWTAYILAVPAAHGRIVFAAPVLFFTGKKIKPERFLWSFSLMLHSIVFLLAPNIYLVTGPLFIFYRIIVTPSYWGILFLGALGAWYRAMLAEDLDAQHLRKHTIIRHLLLIFGAFLILFLLHKEFIVYLNATSTG